MRDIHIKGSALTGTIIEGDLIPRMIDEIPILAVAGLVATGQTTIKEAISINVSFPDFIRVLNSIMVV